MEIKIEKATLNHLKQIQELNLKLFEHDLPFDAFLNKDWPMSKAGIEYFEKAIANENYCTFVAIIENEVVGYLIGYLWSHWNSRPIKTAEIDNIIVLESYKGSGIGKKLIENFKTWCKEKEVKDLIVMTYSENTDALEFYRKIGFKDLSIRLHQTL